jgi:hypothetical protein
MNPDQLIVEARAKITWGEPSSSVRYFLISNGMSAADADAKLKELNAERNGEIRRRGIRNILIGGTLVVGAGILLYSVYASSHVPSLNVRSGKGYGFVVLAGFYGLWKLVNGIICLVRPQAEHESISDVSE